jgi:hypothetical protein
MATASIYATDYYFLQSQNGTNSYLKSNDPFFTQDRIARLTDVEETIETNIVSVPKASWVITAEAMYTNNLTQVGFDGAWTNMNITIEDVGIVLLFQIDQTNDVTLSNFATKKKSILESLYNTLNGYSRSYGITDMRIYPYGSEYILQTTNHSTYIWFGTNKYYHKQ